MTKPQHTVEQTTTERPRDIGVQPERTSLSWRRTLLVIMIHLIIFTKLSITYQQWWLVGVMILVLGGVVICYLSSQQAERQYWHTTQKNFLSSTVIKLMLVGCVNILALSYLTLILIRA